MERPRRSWGHRLSVSDSGGRIEGLPALQRPALGQRAQLARVQLPDQDDAGIGTAEPLRAAVVDNTLALLRHVILDGYRQAQIGDLIDVALAGQDVLADLRRGIVGHQVFLVLAEALRRLAGDARQNEAKGTKALVVDGDPP